jgi:methylglyoxal reductase
MRLRQLGKTNIKASVIGLGTWAIGGGSWWGETDDAESIRTIQAALDAGITLVDTAPAYGFGRSEEVVGKAVRGRRDQVVLATKCGLWWKDSRGSFFFAMDGRNVMRCLRPETIREELELSLRRLGTDYIDLYQTHWQAMEADPTPIADTMACLMQLKDQGKIRAIGVSYVTKAQMDEYRSAGDLVSNQPRYSMLDRAIEPEILGYCQANNVSILAYSPLEQGLLTGKIGMDRTLTDTEARNAIPWFRPGPRQRVLNMLAGWRDLTDRYQCTLSQLVIAWTVQQPGITVALCGARHPAQVIENAKAGDLVLQPADITRMRQNIEQLGKPE